MIVGVVGLGLMGGSLALALKDNKFISQIIGYNRNPKNAKDALDLGIVESLVTLDELYKISDLIIFATPVDTIINELQSIKNIKKDATIIDLGSTKKTIIDAVPTKIREQFVATHPMAGTEYSGPKAAFSTLYKDKIVVLCDIENSGDKQHKIVKEMYESIGMKIVYMNGAEHDEHAAFISHMPHIISYSLANSVLAQESPEAILTLAAGGFRDMSRLAKSSPYMWRDIFKENKTPLLSSIDYFEKELTVAKELINNEKWDQMIEWMSKAQSLHDLWNIQ